VRLLIREIGCFVGEQENSVLVSLKVCGREEAVRTFVSEFKEWLIKEPLKTQERENGRTN